jgi:hypothetical protein
LVLNAATATPSLTGSVQTTIGNVRTEMPYVSEAQRGYMHAQKGKKVPAKVVDEFDAASKGQHGLPKHVKGSKSKGKKGSKRESMPMKKGHCGDCPISFA